MTDAQPRIDLDSVVEHVGLDRADVVELLQLFFSQATTQLAQIRDGIAPGGNLDNARRNAHTLKGTAATLALNELGELARVVEQSAREKRTDAIASEVAALAARIDAWRNAFQQATEGAS
ncbi:MAG: Hpt domain-containing protein [Planctomycetota bacterium]